MIDAIPQVVVKPPPISKTDDAFLDAGVEFIWSNDVNMDELNELFQKVGLMLWLYVKRFRKSTARCFVLAVVSVLQWRQSLA